MTLTAYCIWSAIAGSAMGQATDFFEKKIRPVLVEQCYPCHSSQSAKIRGGLRLDSREGWKRGGDSGPAIIPGKPNESPRCGQPPSLASSFTGDAARPFDCLRPDQVAALEQLLPDRWLQAHPEHRTEERQRELENANAARRQRRARRRNAVKA